MPEEYKEGPTVAYPAFPQYKGPKGPDPDEATRRSLGALVKLLQSMGIYSITIDPEKKDSDIHVQYVNASEDEVGSRLYWGMG